MKVPESFRAYLCADYFASELSETGLWDESAQLRFVLPASEVEERNGGTFLVVARPGSDGIDFGYRSGLPGIWAYHPYEDTYSFMANTVAELVEGWYSGRLSV